MSARAVWGRVGVLAALALLLGAIAGLAWSQISDLPTYLVHADSHATMTERGMTEWISSDFWFSMLGVIVGIMLGIFAWGMLRDVGWPVAFLAVAAALLGGLSCWAVGELLGPGQFAPRMAAAEPGDEVQIALNLHTPSALAIWAFAAVAVPLFASSLGPESPAAPRRRRSRALDDAAMPEA